MEQKQKFNIGDLVQLQIYIRKPKLKGIILRELGYSDDISDIVYEVYTYTRSGFLRSCIWPQRTIQILSDAS